MSWQGGLLRCDTIAIRAPLLHWIALWLDFRGLLCTESNTRGKDLRGKKERRKEGKRVCLSGYECRRCCERGHDVSPRGTRRADLRTRVCGSALVRSWLDGWLYLPEMWWWEGE